MKEIYDINIQRMNNGAHFTMELTTSALLI